MAKGKARAKRESDKRANKARRMQGGGSSKYAEKHPKGSGNTGPNGMWEIVERQPY